MLITSESSDCFPLLDYLFDKKVTRFLLLLLLLKVIKMEIDVHKVKFCICHFFLFERPCVAYVRAAKEPSTLEVLENYMKNRQIHIQRSLNDRERTIF